VREARVTETCAASCNSSALVIESEARSPDGRSLPIQSAHHAAERWRSRRFSNHHLLLMPLGEIHGISPGAEVIATRRAAARDRCTRSRAAD